MFAFACSALFFETFAYLSDLSKRRTRYSSDCWTFALRWRFVDAKTTTCCVRNFVTTFVCRLFHSLNNSSFLNAWCFSKSSFFLNQDFFIEKQKDDVDDVIFSSLNACWASTSSSLKVVCWISLKSIECRIDFLRHMFEILSFSIILILHWNDQIEWLLSQLTHFFLFIDILHVESLCDLTQTEHRRSYEQILSMWLYRWQLKHWLIRQLLTNSSQDICVYLCKKSSLIRRLICSALWIFTINDDNSFSSLMTLFDQIILAIRKFECKISFCFSMRRIIFCWLLVCTSITRISWVNTSKILDIAYVDEATFFIKELLIISRFLIFFERVINFTFSLKRRFVIITFSFIFSIHCRRSINFLTKSVRKLFFSLCSLILKISVFFS
jgi:hypothetical protein